VSLPFNIYSWIDFKNHLEGKSTLEKGTAFEELTKLYLEYHPVYRTKLKTVWLQKEIPTTVRESLNLPSNDQGIDLVAETYEGTYWAIQCKYLQDENQTLSHRSMIPIPRTILSIPIESPPSNQTIGGNIGGDRLAKQLGGRNQKKGN